jgi:hypothetical protein
MELQVVSRQIKASFFIPYLSLKAFRSSGMRAWVILVDRLNDEQNF